MPCCGKTWCEHRQDQVDRSTNSGQDQSEQQQETEEQS